jgi:hypothetical protein
VTASLETLAATSLGFVLLGAALWAWHRSKSRQVEAAGS